MQVLKSPSWDFCYHNLPKINEDDLNEQHDYGVPFSEQQYTQGACNICLNANPLISLIPPNGLKF